MNIDPGTADLLIQFFNYRFEQVDKRFEQLERRCEAIEVRFSSIEAQLNTQLRWIIGLMAPIYLALIALVLKVFLGS